MQGKWVVLLVGCSAALFLGMGILLGFLLDDAETVRPEPVSLPTSGELVQPNNDGKSPARRSRREPRRRTQPAPRRGTVTVPLPPSRRLALSLLAARERWWKLTSVTRRQKALRSEVSDGSCEAEGDRYRCTISELQPPPEDTHELERACRVQAKTRLQKSQCAAPASRTSDTIEFEVTLRGDGCWSARLPDGVDPSGSANLAGCLSR